MFAQLAPLVTGATTLAITVSRADSENLHVTVTPIPGKDDTLPQALNAPLSITGTPAELDADLPGVLARYVPVRANAAAALKKLEDDLAEEQRAAQKRLADERSKGSSKPAKPGAAASDPAPATDAPGKNAQPALF